MTPAQKEELRKLLSDAKLVISQDGASNPLASPLEKLVAFIESNVMRPPCSYCGKAIRNRDHEGLGIDVSPLCRTCSKDEALTG